eukprot:m.491004 g.491004  ORF g.491004 m.491004 type:complete len:361 (-) comp28992_c0_seq1:123-1205(-)
MAYAEGVQGKQHIKYLQRCRDVLPTQMLSLDVNRMTATFFVVSGLDLLSALDTLDQPTRVALVDWIYDQQVVARGDGARAVDGDNSGLPPAAGFRGGPFLGVPRSAGADAPPLLLDGGHLASTYTALCLLAVLGDDYTRLDRTGVARDLSRYQLPSGAFVATPQGGESDMRFVYCACCVAFMLDDWSGIDTAALQRFIVSSLAYDGGIGQAPGLEPHAASAYLALSSLKLMGCMETVLSVEQRMQLTRWLVNCQGETGGFHGRMNKDDDTCYSFWAGGALAVLERFDLVDQDRNRAFLKTTQFPAAGGFGKVPGMYPDPMHSYMGLSSLAMMGEQGFAPLDPVLNISQAAASRLPRHVLA